MERKTIKRFSAAVRSMSVLLAAAVLVLLPLSVHAETTVEGQYVYGAYTYDFWGDVKECPPAFRLVRTIGSSSFSQCGIKSADDVMCSGSRIFVVDKLSSRLDVLDEEGKLLSSVKVIHESNGNIAINSSTGKQIVLKNPEGVYVDDKTGEIYIADTGNERLVVLDSRNYTFKRIIGRPSSVNAKMAFKPSKVAVDKDGRIYIVVQSSYEGIIELNRGGSFARYLGVNKPKVNLIDYFWKSIASKTQRQKMRQTLAPSFNNIDVDPEGFVYATTCDTNAQDMVFRLNSKGENVLREMGNTKVEGDPEDSQEDPSKMADIAVTDFGAYALLDKTRGRIFLYDFDGNLLNVFSGLGNTKGQLIQPTGICWIGDNLAVTDEKLLCVNIYAPTEFGKVALKASKEYFNGDWDSALTDFKSALKLNANYDVAYVGIGKNYLMKRDYASAMYYLKLGNDREDYSKAYNKYRSAEIEKHFGIIMFLIVAGITLLIYSEYRYSRKTRYKV